MREISFKEVREILRRGIWFVILIPLIVTSIAGLYYYLYMEDQYTAEAKLYVLIDYGDSTGSTRYDISTSTSFVGDAKLTNGESRIESIRSFGDGQSQFDKNSEG